MTLSSKTDWTSGCPYSLKSLGLAALLHSHLEDNLLNICLSKCKLSKEILPLQHIDKLWIVGFWNIAICYLWLSITSWQFSNQKDVQGYEPNVFISSVTFHYRTCNNFNSMFHFIIYHLMSFIISSKWNLKQIPTCLWFNP